MICDHYVTALECCKNTPMRAPRLVVPSRTGTVASHPPLRIFTTLHYCELHTCDIKAADLLRANIRRDFEAAAKKNRALDFKCNFDKASIEYVLVTTPEYRTFLASMGYAGVMGAAMLHSEAQKELRARLGVTRLAG